MEIEAGSKIHIAVINRTSEGYTISNIYAIDDNQNQIAIENEGDVYSFTMPAEDVTISVTYAPIKYTITTDDYSSVEETKVSAGKIVNVTFSQRDGYTLSSAKFNNTALTISNNAATFTMPAGNVSITATYTPIEYTITSDQYSTPSKTKANVGDEITVTFSQRSGYTLSSAKVNNTALTISNNAATFTMPAENVSISATYTPIEYTIISDQYSTPSKTKANVGDEITVNFAQRSGYTLSSAKFNNTALTISNNQATFTMPAENVSITATYTPIEYTITSDQYSTPSETKANIGEVISVNFAQRSGYTLSSAKFNNTALTITNNQAKFTMPAENVSITATYTPIEYTITADQYSTPNKTKANIGEEITVNFAQRNGYTLSSAKVNNTALTISNGSAKFTMPAENVSISATYTAIDYSITADQYSTPNKTKANIGEEITVSFSQRSGYTLSSAKFNNTALTISNNAAKFTMPAGNVSITATYTPIEYTITSDQYSTPSKTKANVGDEITVTFSQRDGYTLSSAKFNNTALTISNNAAKFSMPAKNVSITATYTAIDYTITSDQYSTPSKTKANIGEEITVTFSQRSGYTLSSAKVNNTALTITNSAAKFSMPAENVSITATYTAIDYTITSDQYSTPSKTKANIGDEITVNFSQRDGYTLSSAKFNNTALTISNNQATFTMPAENVSISATYTAIDYTITSDQYSTPNKTKANIGDEISVTFSQRSGYTLSSAKVNNTALTISNNAATFTMPAENVSITTTYTPIEYTITSDQYSTPSKTKANIGEEITVNFAQRNGYTLSSAKVNNTALTITNNQAKFTMPAENVSITATYTAIDYTITSDQYSTPSKSKANIGEEITVNFAQRSGYTLSSAKFNNTALTISNNAATFTMPAENVSITATYTPIEYTITSDQYSTPSKTKANVGEEISVTFSQRSGYTLSSAKFNNTALTISNNAAKFTMPAGNVSITATYTAIEYNVTCDEFVTANKTKATINDKVTFTVQDRTNDGYKLDKVFINNVEVSVREFEMKNFLQDVTITAQYSKIETEQKPEIITDGNVEINLPDNIQENSLVYFTVAQKEGYSAFVYVNGSLTDEYSFIFKGKVEIKVDYKELTVTNISKETEGYCAGDEVNISFTTNPYAKMYEITFSNEAQKEGFENVDFKDVMSYENQDFTLKIPKTTKPGKYHAFIRVKDSKDSRSRNFEFDIEVFYPNDIVETKYSDMICVNNFKNEYIGYQWIKNNQEIKGANKQFYFDMPHLNGIYSVILVKQSGEKIRTCNLKINDLSSKKAAVKTVKVYPNPAKSNEPFTIELAGFDGFSDTYILIYNQLGVLIEKITDVKESNVLSLKSGFYSGVAVSGNSKLTFKIIVND